MWNYIRRNLGLVSAQLRNESAQATILNSIHEIKNDLQGIKTKQDVVLSGIGRILAQVGDTQFAKSPHDPKVQAESKKIGKKVIERLEAEAKVRSHYGYNK